MKKVNLLVLMLLLLHCKSLSISKETHTKTSQSLEIGAIGEDKIFLLEEDYNSTALPIYNNPIKINISVLNFNNSSYKAFSKANNSRTVPLQITFVDSLSEKPKFLKLEIADRVTVLNALKDPSNKDIKEYILNKKNAHIISAISLVLDDTKMKSTTDADTVFLEQDGEKNYIINAYKNSQLVSSIHFNEGVVFAYQASNFCWQENSKHQLNIVDIVESTDKCPNNSYRSAKRAKKKIDYFKF